MTPVEAVGVARYIAAHFPQQPINEYTPEALEEVLQRYSVADARQAVLNLSTREGEGARWCAPSDVAREVKRIRAKRIREAGDLTPPPGLTEPEERAWIGAARRQIADGGEPPAPPQLTPRPMPDLRALLPKPPEEDT